MNLVPFENIEIRSPLSKSEVLNTVRRNIEWTTNLGMTFTKNSLREYEGYIESNAFKIRRILKGGMNSFIPIVSGTVIEHENNSSRIILKLRLHKVVIIFCIVMTVFAGFLFIINLISSPVQYISAQDYIMELSIDEQLKSDILKDRSESPNLANFSWNSLLLFIAPYIFATIFFNYEANTIKDKLNSILYVKEGKQ